MITKKITKTLFAFFIAFISLDGMAQTGVAGSASLGLSDDVGFVVQGTRIVQVHVDVSGLTGLDAEAVGLNSFVITFDISRPEGLSTDVFAYAVPGTDPGMNWNFAVTDRDSIHSSLKVTLVGWVADPDAPNRNYVVSNMVFTGEAGDVTLTFDPDHSSLGSRVVISSGDGPGPIPISQPALAYTFSLVEDFPLSTVVGCCAWKELNPDYDLAAPEGKVDILDLTALINCGAL